MTDGAAFSGNKASGSGGAINHSGVLDIRNSNFTGNNSSSYGGAINTSGQTLIQGTTFKLNKGSEGGALYTPANKGNLTIIDSHFIGNSTTISSQGYSDFGGAINNSGRMEIVNTSFEDNSSTAGGAIKIRSGSTESIISSGIFNGNFAVVGAGGAINHVSGNLEINETDFNENKSVANDGGAIYSDGTGLTVNGGSFSESHADNGSGGAIYATKTTVLKKVAFEGNTALKGGGISNNGNMTIGGGSEFTGNTASVGGAIFTQNTLTLDTNDGNILFKGNTATDASQGGADIYLHKEKENYKSEVIISGNGNILSMDGGFSGTGEINKIGANTLKFEKTPITVSLKGHLLNQQE